MTRISDTERISPKAAALPPAAETTHSNHFHRKRQETPSPKATQGTQDVQQVPRSHTCGLYSMSCKARPSRKKRRLPLTSLVTPEALPSCSTHRTNAVLPKRRRLFESEGDPKGFSYNSITNHGPIEIPEPSENISNMKRGRPENELLRKQCTGPHHNSRGYPGTTPTGKESLGDGIDSAKIFRQLNILKRGGYWEHLPKEGGQGEEWYHDDEEGQDRNLVRKQANKENVPRIHHPNTRNTYAAWEDEEDEEDHDTDREEEPFVGSAFAFQHKDTETEDSFRIGFCIHAIIEDGWMCSSERVEGGTGKSFEGDDAKLVLLHLPTKVAALGKEGMCFRGVELMVRRDNGALEPHTHGNHRGFPWQSSMGTPANSLFGRISL